MFNFCSLSLATKVEEKPILFCIRSLVFFRKIELIKINSEKNIKKKNKILAGWIQGKKIVRVKKFFYLFILNKPKTLRVKKKYIYSKNHKSTRRYIFPLK